MIDLHKLDKFRLKDREREFYGCTGDSASAARHGTRCARLRICFSGRTSALCSSTRLSRSTSTIIRTACTYGNR